MGATMVLVGASLLRARPLLTAVDPAWSPAGPYVMIGCGGLSIAAVLVLSPRIALATLTASAAATLLAIQASVLSLGRPEPVEIVAAAIRAQDPSQTICTCGAFTRNLIFYTRRRTVVGETEADAQRILEQTERALVVLEEPVLARIEQATGRRFARLAEVLYLNTNALRTEDLLDPDPSRKLQRVVLVSNR
jgi:hypothetical protein